MKKILLFAFVLGFNQLFSQSFTDPLPIPPALTGTTFNLTVDESTRQFKPGQITDTYGVNQDYLGPTLIMNAGDFVTLNVTNDLAETTTMHWHGFHVAPMDDGGPHTIIPVGATWSPDFTVMNKASVYWYHPHRVGLTNKHVSNGAAGMIIVKDTEEAALTLPRTYGVDDIPIIVQTKLLDNNNQIRLDAQFDSIPMVNGTINPYVEAPAQMVRFRALNASSARTINIGADDNRTLYQISSDGGLLENPVAVTRIRLSNGERAEFLVDLTGETIGNTFELKSYMSELPDSIEGGTGSAGHPNDLFGTDWSFMEVRVVAQTSSPITTLPGTMTSITPIPEANATVNRYLELTGNSDINNMSMDMLVINEIVELNDTEIWTVYNDTPEAHPIHIHDVQFFVLDRNGSAPSAVEAGYKDTVLVEANETVRLIMKFEDFADDTIPYMYHCHNLLHEDMGMMGQFKVVDNSLGIAENLEDAVIVYPNPTFSHLNIRIPDAYQVENISLYDLNGKRLLNIPSNIQGLDLHHIPKGMYFLAIKTDKGEVTKQIVKS